MRNALTARDVARALADGVRGAGQHPVVHPIADGGEGSRDALVAAMDGAGLAAPLRAALGAGCTQVIVQLGGAATMDGGLGLLAGLGCGLRDERGRCLRGSGCDLNRIDMLDLTPARAALAGIDLVIATDVHSPLGGPSDRTQAAVTPGGTGHRRRRPPRHCLRGGRHNLPTITPDDHLAMRSGHGGRHGRRFSPCAASLRRQASERIDCGEGLQPGEGRHDERLRAGGQGWL
ncbi:MAG: glycerate kinase [Sciscionella sp.]